MIKVYIPNNIISGVYQNNINFDNNEVIISQLFGFVQNHNQDLDLIILYTSDNYTINNLNKLNNDIEIWLPETVNKLALFIKLNKNVKLEAIDNIYNLNIKYLIVNQDSSESNLFNLYSVENNTLDKLESEFIILNNEYEILNKFNISICSYTLCIENTIAKNDLITGLKVPDKLISTEINNIIQSIDLDNITLEDHESLESDITAAKVINLAESKTIDDNSLIISVVIQIAALFKTNSEIDVLQLAVRDKFTKFKSHLNVKIKSDNFDYFTSAISKVELKKEQESVEIPTQPKNRVKSAKSKSGKSGKSVKKHNIKPIKKDESNDSIILANKLPYIPVSKTGSVSLDIELNSSTSSTNSLIIKTNTDSTDDDSAEAGENLENGDEYRIKISIIFKLDFLKSLSGNYKSIPITIPYYHFIDQLSLSDIGYPCYIKYPYLIEPFTMESLLPDNIIINPHSKMDRPSWVSPKNSSVATISGRFAYYHYCMDDIDDSGWGCCYRSLQMIWSWYLLQNYTVEKVPTHWDIQRILNENDTVGKVIKIGTSTWIGTVESSYIINWKLNMLCKIYYLSDYSYLADYSMVIKEHFLLQKTPIIMGIGNYAYVILGICLDSDNESTYLIADPHYSGSDNIKSITSKGVGWKRPEFLNKAVDSGFINLLLPQTNFYND